jgi:hypothetical protein
MVRVDNICKQKMALDHGGFENVEIKYAGGGLLLHDFASASEWRNSIPPYHQIENMASLHLCIKQ